LGIIIKQKSRLAEIIDLATQVWAIAGVFLTFAENSLQFVFVSSGFGIESIAHILTVENFRYNSFGSAQSLQRYLA
jgi:hypothetical protein